MRYWWVNQKKTYKHEVSGGFLWSPKRNKNGARNQYYENMKEVQPGDIVFSYREAKIPAIGVVRSPAETTIKPDFGAAGAKWSSEGWFVRVEFRELPEPLSPKSHMDRLAPLLPEKYSPLQTDGNGKEFYLTELPLAFATQLLALIGDGGRQLIGSLEAGAPEIAEEFAAVAIAGRTDIGETTKTQLTNARRGQGVFRANVRINEKFCRVTKVADPDLLVASHIKPWRDSDDTEKLNGCNGLLLAPHVDRLFDRGLIAFADDGRLLVSSKLDSSVLRAWGIPSGLNVGAFAPEQAAFLRYHRQKVFLQ